MGIIGKILNRVNVLVVTFRDNESYDLQLIKCKYKSGEIIAVETVEAPGITSIQKDLSSFPVVMVITGYGVITKSIADMEIVTKITADGSGFTYTLSDTHITFAKNSQLEELKTLTGSIHAKVIDAVCSAQTTDIPRNISEIYGARLRFRNMIRPDESGSAMAELVVSRIKLPSLGLVLIAMLINSLVSPSIRSDFESARTELEILRKKIGKAEEVSIGQQQIIGEYNLRQPYAISLICDRAAETLPDGITLTYMAFQPLTRTLENNKKPVFLQRELVISGETPDSDHVSAYVSRLNQCSMFSQVKLSSMEHDREKGIFNFRIRINL